MKIFSAHLPRGGGKPDAVLVKEGFCWPAFFFTFLWTLVHRMWWEALALLTAGALIDIGSNLAGLGPPASAAIAMGFSALVGYEANELRRRWLLRRGYQAAGLIVAPTMEMADHRFLLRAEDASR